MPIILLIVIIALTFGFVFAKLDTLTKMSKILKDDISKIKEDIEKNRK